MMNPIAKPRAVLLALLLSIICAIVKSSQAGNRKSITADPNTSVRLFFPKGDYLRPALLFRVSALGDKESGTAPIGPLGRSAYISLAEMNALVEVLLRSGDRWKSNSRASEIKPFRDLPITKQMQVTIFMSSETARGALWPSRMCETLAKANAAITTPRAHWEFQMYRRMYSCEVEGFDPVAYPDHY